jgi:hypothetical protein
MLARSYCANTYQKYPKREKSIEGSSNGCECGRIRFSKLEYICFWVEEAYYYYYLFIFSRVSAPSVFFLFWRFVCGSGFALRLRRPRKLGRPSISEGAEKDREGGPDEKSAVWIPPAAIAR